VATTKWAAIKEAAIIEDWLASEESPCPSATRNTKSLENSGVSKALDTPDRNRTCDLGFRKASLYPLSYGSVSYLRRE
jgi:hypothetical protein